MTGRVIFEELKCRESGYKIGLATLDNTPSLNALTFNMLTQLNDMLIKWQDEDLIVSVFLDGAGDKAFCAGGDVRTMHNVMRDESKASAQDFCISYFTLEYQCDYLIHTYRKPIIGWGDGIVMGGGVGLFMGVSHKVVTPKSRLAMPEISIGLYPDVGGTWFLNRLDDGIGMFLGLTGALVNASDAVDIHLADYLLLSEHKGTLLEQLQTTSWDSVDDHYALVDELLGSVSLLAQSYKPENHLMPYFSQIQIACAGDDLNTIKQNILAINDKSTETEDKWLSRAKQTFMEGSPITAHICHRQLTQYHSLSLAGCFRLELNLSVRSGLLGEFQEGVRARLIDKSGEPDWMFKAINQVDTELIDTLFTSLWPEGRHPLADLGK